MLFEGRPGPSVLGDGSIAAVRLGRDGAVAAQDAHARYQEAAFRGNVFWVADQAGATTPAGLSTAPINVCLFNPKGNNKLAVILYASFTMIVANLAAAIVWVAVNNNVAAAAVTGTAATVFNGYIGNANRSSISAFTTATLPAAPVAIDVLGAGLTGAITTLPSLVAMSKEYAGSIVLGPGSAISFQTSTASGAAGAVGAWAWEEVSA